ncbi:MAG: histidinol-phosphate transaminase [bacterium]|nr:histidinol-phosphate transaminase [bacterium]
MQGRFRPVHDTIEDLVPYSAGRPIEDVAREKGLTRIVKLASNENPMGMSPRALEAAGKAVAGVHRYPDGAARELKEKLAEHHGVDPEMVVLGNGSNEILEIMAQLFLADGGKSLYAWPAFVVYRLATLAHGGRGVEVPLTPDLRHDLDAMALALDESIRLVYIANPNNPTGTYVTKEELERFMEKVPESVPLVLDEAYFEFAAHLPDFPNGLDYLRRGRSLVVARTFSKAYGLAGLRVGYAIMPRELAQFYNRVRQPFNVNSIAQAAACAALEDDEFVAKSLEHNSRELQRIEDAVTGMGLTVTKSYTNFILIDLAGRPGQGVYEGLLDRGIIVRPMAGYGLPGTIRVTAGLAEENELFLEALGKVIETAVR